MATLQAVVDIQDRASAKFAQLTSSAKIFEEQLDRVDRKLKDIEERIIAVSKQKITIKVALDTSAFDSQLVAMLTRAKIASGADVNMGSGLGGLAALDGGGGDSEIFDDIEDPVAKIIDRSKAKGLGVNRLDNGFIGFLSVATRLALNFRAIVTPLTNLIGNGLARAFAGAEKILKIFGVTMNAGSTVMKGLQAAIAATVAWITALSAASTLFVSIGTAFAGIIAVIAAAVTTLIAPLAAVTTGITALVGVIGFVAIPMGNWISETKDLVQQKDELTKKLEGLTVGSDEYNQTLKEREEIQKKLDENGGEAIFRQMEKFKEKVNEVVFTQENKQTWVDILSNGMKAAEPLLASLGRLVSLFSNEVLKVAEGLRSWTSNTRNVESLERFFSTAAPLISTFASVLGGLGRIFMAISTAAAPLANIILKDLSGWLNGIADNLSSPRSILRMRGFFMSLYEPFKKIVVLLKDFVVGFVRLGTRMMPYLEPLIEFVGEFGAKLVEWVVETVEKYGPTLVDIIGKLGQFISIAWDFLTKLFDALEPVINNILRLVGVVLDFATAVLGIAEKLHIIDALKIAFELLAVPVGIVLGLLEKIVSAMEFLANTSPKDWIAGPRDEWPDNPNDFQGYAPPDVMERQYPGWKQQPDGTWVKGASGGIVTKPTMALIGEAGPEAVVPLHAASGARRLPSGVGGGRAVTITGDLHFHGVQNLNQFVAEVQKYVENLPREDGNEVSVG